MSDEDKSPEAGPEINIALAIKHLQAARRQLRFAGRGITGLQFEELKAALRPMCEAEGIIAGVLMELPLAASEQ